MPGNKRKAPTKAPLREPWRRYHKLERLGSGSYGTVHRCSGEGGQVYAVKVYKPVRGGDLGVDVVRELAALRTLDRHPNIPTVREIGFAGKGAPFVVMSYAGRSLWKSFGKYDECVSATRLRRIGAQLIAAVAHCHEQGVLHRDVKPCNVCVISNSGEDIRPSYCDSSDDEDEAGAGANAGAGATADADTDVDASAPVVHMNVDAETEGERVCLLDMGLSRGGDLGGRLSLSVCTETYRSLELLEVCEDEELENLEYGPGLDVWGCACTLFELATAVPLFNGDEEIDIFRNVCARLGLKFKGHTVGRPRDRLASYAERNLPLPEDDPTWTPQARGGVYQSDRAYGRTKAE